MTAHQSLELSGPGMARSIMRALHALARGAFAICILATGVAMLPGTAAAEDFPARAIQVVVPFAAGGGLDLGARNFAQVFAEIMRQPAPVTNRDGASGAIGLQAVAIARPDGYTVVYTPAVSLSSEPHRNKSIAYSLDSFRYVCQVFDNIFSIAVTRDSPYRSVADIVADARRNPGKVSYGTAGMGSIPHLGTSDIEVATKVQLNHIPYRGDGPMMQDMLSSRLNFGAMLASSITGQIKAGQLRLLAVFSDQRHPGFPDVPTLGEVGIPVAQLSFGGLLVPAKTPDNVVAALESGCEKAVKSTAFNDWAARANQVVSFQNGAAFEARMRKDSQIKAATLKRLNLAP